MRSIPEREHVRFDIAGTECAAWHYPGTTGACVIMAGGFAVTNKRARHRPVRPPVPPARLLGARLRLPPSR
jgi:hypothetical protein